MVVSLFGRSRELARGPRRTPASRRNRRLPLGIDRLESRIALAVDTLSIGASQAAVFTDATDDVVTVSITGSAGTAVFRNAGGGIVDNGDEIATVEITGASPDFQLTFGASPLFTTGSIGALNGYGLVNLGRITADSVIRGVNTVPSDATVGTGGSAAAFVDPIDFVLESFRGVDFSKGGGLFVDVVTGDAENVGIVLTKGFSPYTTIAIREVLDADVFLGTQKGARVDGRLLIESATPESEISVNKSGDTGANSKLEIVGGEGPFDAIVGVRGAFAGTVNLQAPAGGFWVFDSVAPSAVLNAVAWEGFREGMPEFSGVTVLGDFAGTINSTGLLKYDQTVAYPAGGVDLRVVGNVKGTARVNSGGALQLLTEGNVLPGAQFNTIGPCQMEVGGDFSGGLSAGASLLAYIGGNLSGAKLVSAGDIGLAVGLLPTTTAIDGSLRPRSIVKSSLVAASDIQLAVTGDVVKSSFVGRNILFGGVDSEKFGASSLLPPLAKGILGSIKSSTFTAGGGLEGTVGGSAVSSVIQAQIGMGISVFGGVSKSRLVTTEGELHVSTGRDFQGAIQGGAADVWLLVDGSVLKGSSLATSSDAEVSVAGNFDGVVDVDQLQFYVDGNVAKGARIVAHQVWDWQNEVPEQNFRIGGRFDGVVNVGVFDAAPNTPSVSIIGGGAGSSARFYVGRFETDEIVFEGDFKGNLRVLQDLAPRLVFIGNVDRISIGGQVLNDIFVAGRLSYLNSNSYFSPDLPGKQTGRFLNGSFQQTGALVSGSYVTVLPPSPAPV